MQSKNADLGMSMATTQNNPYRIAVPMNIDTAQVFMPLGHIDEQVGEHERGISNPPHV